MPKYRNLNEQNGLSYIRTGLARNILQARKDSGLTQEELTLKAGISRTTLANIEGLRQSVTLELLYSLADALQISICDLLPSNTYAQKSKAHEPSDLRKRLLNIKELAECIVEEC